MLKVRVPIVWGMPGIFYKVKGKLSHHVLPTTKEGQYLLASLDSAGIIFTWEYCSDTFPGCHRSLPTLSGAQSRKGLSIISFNCGASDSASWTIQYDRTYAIRCIRAGEWWCGMNGKFHWGEKNFFCCSVGTWKLKNWMSGGKEVCGRDMWMDLWEWAWSVTIFESHGDAHRVTYHHGRNNKWPHRHYDSTSWYQLDSAFVHLVGAQRTQSSHGAEMEAVPGGKDGDYT